ncbi:IS30 family transposase [Pectobacterium carotovorum]|uniref:IS30 family transposase n=1 Tax=Pectobacterium carotovorum TaxID=554 RepID=UPI0010FF3612|nr:IS30 family transposase [Pectobacterium carotovorum]KAA3666399.1 IS30 family transposase [Pectobacterium carotovorum subsp. carotovorum]UCZ78478.1 IS30 family transposase [Pectobacterium carotovorum]
MQKIIHKTRDKNHARRLTAILMLHRGDRVIDVARTLCCARSSVGRWINWFTLSGVERLKSLPAGHCRRWPFEHICALLRELIRHSPGDFGYQRSGHWEGDLIQGSKNSYIVTPVERHSRFVMLAKIRDNKTITVISALIKQARELPVELYKTLTWDRGAEMTSHTRLTVATDIQIYFCDPQSPWQRGSNENTNRLLRQYFPKGTDLSVHSQLRLNSVARQLNERPRKTLDYESPADRFNKCVAFIG